MTIPLQNSLDRLTIQIKDNTKRLQTIIKETDDLKLSLEAFEEINNNKTKGIDMHLKKYQENTTKD